MIKINPDLQLEEAQEILNAIKESDGYCPCRIDQNEDTKCICKEFRESNDLGPCHCGLYTKI